MIVQGPDGKVISFPDSMSADDVNAAMGQLYGGASAPTGGTPGVTASAAPPQSTGAERALKLGSNALFGGLGTIAGTPGTLAQLGGTAVARAYSALGGGGADDEQHSLVPWLPTIEQIHDVTGKLGLTQRNDTVPGWGTYPETEKLATAGVSGAASAIPGALAPEAAPLRVLAAGTAGGLGGELGAEAAPGNPLAPVVGGLAGGLGVQGLAGAEPKLPALARGLSPVKDLESAGTNAQVAARAWLAPLPENALDRSAALSANSTFQAKLANAWAPVDSTVPAAAPAKLDNFKSVLGGMTQGAGGLTDALKVITPSLPARLQKALTPAGWGPGGPPVTWADLQTFRSALGDAMSNPQVVKDIPATQLSALYSGLTKDMEAVASAHGAGDAFALANQESQRLYAVASGPMAKLVSGAKASGDDPLPGKAAKGLLTTGKTDGGELAALRGEIPTAVDALASAHLLQTPEGWTKLSPSARAALVPDPAKRAVIDQAVSDAAGAKGGSFLHTLESLAGGSVGQAASGLLPHGLLPDAAGPAMHLLGFAAPSIYRGARSVVRDPSQLALPALGAASGVNALYQGPFNGLGR